ncbi:MAG: ribose 5-phosphate isomerase B [Candidatus Aminicenantes bacterium]|nr:MAG: ribose 5-phosphate isomerase B [Candidatus Aminicenantes bacterium]
MKIALASDHAGYELKKSILNYLSERRVQCEDFGCGPDEKVDYVDYAEKSIEQICIGEYERAILVCGTGIGMAIVANKYKGIRATPCTDEYSAEMSRKHNDSNCLTLGARILPQDEALGIVKVWLETEFEGGRHQGRLDKILRIEKKNYKS